MQIGEILYNQIVPSEYPHFGGLTIKGDNLALCQDFANSPRKSIYKVQQDDLSYIQEVEVGRTISCIRYDAVENIYWLLSLFERVPDGDAASRILKVDLEGNLLESIPCKEIVPEEDQSHYWNNWFNATAHSMTITPDRQYFLVNMQESKRIYKFRMDDNSYAGYFDLEEAIDRNYFVAGISVDEESMWYCIKENDNVEEIFFYQCDFTGKTLNAIVVPSSSFGLSGSYRPLEVQYDATSFPGKKALWFITYRYADQRIVAVALPDPYVPCETPPALYAVDKIVLLGKPFDVMQDVQAENCHGIDITDLIQVEGTVDVNQEGTYTLAYQVTYDGKTTIKTIQVTVKKDIRDEREKAIADLIESIALEEAAFAHILNAEGEKIQKAVGMDGINKEELQKINQSVTSMVSVITKAESILEGKLKLFEACLCDEEQ